ncbi:pyruvate kinase [Xiamenia xianingshaonis]|uniref:Pyruvate kinase n=1 Tax=Xiamenia xianingshaonis TaxID=2682776 RepID=A0A9E6MR54_9ACTN|nr:pyruvate kinase [Xiamenia xianingshaonis]NHM14346.1 pyruvate kinase [Xiamenia xianingshaonis]QTU84827.1 pyruvate kinase [Xiamenia xianingshaonis]
MPKKTKHTKIVCTLGPAVDSDEAVRGLIEAGMDVARLNFSHGSHDEHRIRMDRVRRVREELQDPCAILLDTAGPEIRTGLLQGGEPVTLDVGAIFTLFSAEHEGDASGVSQTWPGLAKAVSVGDDILVDDGLIGLRVVRIEGENVVCKVLNGGVLGQRKSVNIPGVAVPFPALTDKDREDVLFGIEQNIDFVAVSFVRNADSVREVRAFLDSHGGDDILIIAKIECASAVDDFDEILEAADGIMIARGDLGVEVDASRVPHIQKRIIRACNKLSKPCITATQMLESMVKNPRPTRAEAADVANAVYDGTDAIMLSGETAVGAYPVEAVRTMVQIAMESEAHLYEEHRLDRQRADASVSLAVGQAAVHTAENVHACCIIAPTMSGRTARLMSNLRPRVPIYAVTPFPRVMRQQQLNWGVISMLGDVLGSMNHIVDAAQRIVLERGLVNKGDIAVLTAGDPHTSPSIDPLERPKSPRVAATNVMYVVQV